MTNSPTWQDENSAYLSASIAWLRLRLERCAQGGSGAPSIVKSQDKVRGSKRVTNSLDQRIEEASAYVEKLSADMVPPPALVLIEEALGLSRFERDILLLCTAPEFDGSIRSLCVESSRRLLSGYDDRGLPTFALALSLFDNAAWDALSPDRPLRYWHLLEFDQPVAQPLASSTLRADERIVDFLKGLNRLDERLAPYLTLLGRTESAPPLPASQQRIADIISEKWRETLTAEPLPVIQLVGPNYDSKRMIAIGVAASFGRRIYRLSADSLPGQVSEIELLSRIWQRESALLPVVLFIDGQNGEASSENHTGATRRFLTRSSGFLFLAVREGWSSLARESCSFDVAKPTREEQRSAWEAALSPKQGELPPLLSSQFNLNLPDISRIAQESSAGKRSTNEQIQEKLWDNCLLRVRPVLDSLARRIDTRATWSDIVLPEREQHMLHQISAQVRERARVYEDWGFSARMNRGLGITALFTGDSGVGKTMAGEVIANDLRLNLYRIDLSSVVSKYIGETEKNLCKLFDAAEDGGAILFFDEADALFGKRSEVKDSHDRYANIEVNYLLQRMESFSGLAILATNMRSALDAAFTRRLRFIVNFPFPSMADRERMWRRAFPAQTPVRSLDYSKLARFNLTGGSISNAAINAAFLAAPRSARVTMAHVLTAIHQELIKLDRPIRDADFVIEDDQDEEQMQSTLEERVA